MQRSRSVLYILLMLAFGAAACAPSPAAGAGLATPTAEATELKVAYQSDGLQLVGYLYKPAGSGPFPALVWNPGTEKQPDVGSDLDDIAEAFVPHGYVVFIPLRRGQGSSQGASVADEVKQARTVNGEAAAEQMFVQLMSTQQLNDQLAGLAYLKSQPFVDRSHIAVMGCADGATQALLGAASNAGYRAAVAISPASDTWTGNVPLQDSLMQAVGRINVPVMLLHPSQDVTKASGTELAAEFARQGKHALLKLHVPQGTAAEQTQCFGGGAGVEIWQPEALIFLQQVMQ